MNIIDAVRQRRPFRRHSWNNRNSLSFQDHVNCCMPDKRACHSFTEEDILADDWVVKEKEITITKTSFLEAAARARKRAKYYYNPKGDPVPYNDELFDILNELGL